MQVAIANAALNQLCGLPRQMTKTAASAVFGLWEQMIVYSPGVSRAGRGFDNVITGRGVCQRCAE
jgi:hypothetical protein